MADEPKIVEELNLHTLKPAQPRKNRKRVGRGLGSGKGRYSGRGIKGQKSRAGSHMMRAGFEGGQMPLHMRVGKQKGSTSKDAMPIVPFMTRTAPVNVRDLEARFDAGAEVTPEALVAAGLLKNTKIDVKILGNGDLAKALTVTAHGFSKTAREKIEKAGGTIVWLRGEPKPKKVKHHKAAKPVVEEPEEDEVVEETPVDEAPAEAEVETEPEAEGETES
jgi:large subunit ribosomal protein L15